MKRTLMLVASLVATSLLLVSPAHADYGTPTVTSSPIKANQLVQTRVGDYRLVAWADSWGSMVRAQLLDADSDAQLQQLTLVERLVTRDEDGYFIHRTYMPRLVTLADDKVLLVFLAKVDARISNLPDYPAHRNELMGQMISIANGTVTPGPIYQISNMGNGFRGGMYSQMSSYGISRSTQDGSMILAWPGLEYEGDMTAVNIGVFARRLNADGSVGSAQVFLADWENQYTGWVSTAYDETSDNFVVLHSQLGQKVAGHESLYAGVVDPNLAIIRPFSMIATPRPSPDWAAGYRIWHARLLADQNRYLVTYTDSGEKQLVGCWYDTSFNPLSCADLLTSSTAMKWDHPQLTRIPGTESALLQIEDREHHVIREAIVDLDSSSLEIVHSPFQSVASLATPWLMHLYPYASLADADGTLWLSNQVPSAYGVARRSRKIESIADLAVQGTNTSATAGDATSIHATVSVNSASGEVNSLARSINNVLGVAVPSGIMITGANGCVWDASTSSCALTGSLATDESTNVELLVDTSALAGVTTDLVIGLTVTSTFSTDSDLVNNSDDVLLSLTAAAALAPTPAAARACTAATRGAVRFCNN